MGVRHLAIVLGLALAAPTAPADSGGADCLAAARGIGDFLLEHARRDGDAWSWAQYEGPGPEARGQERRFPVSLYTGTAGTGFFLLNLHRATKEPKYLDAAVGAARHLICTAKPLPGGGLQWEASYERNDRSVPEGHGVGLYTGNAGIGLFLMQAHDQTGDARFRKAAEGAFERILDEAVKEGGGLHWSSSFQDVIGGEAGIGLALLEMHRRTGEARYLEAARGAGRWLLSVARRDGEHLSWERYGYRDAGFSHGAAGIAFFLQRLGEDAAATAVADWIGSVARPCGEDAILWEYYAGEPPEGKRNWVMNSWCHGAPGTIRLFVLLHRATGEPRHLASALQGGGGIRHEARLEADTPFFYNPTLCCGAAGCIDAFCDLYQASGQARWLADAKTLARAIVGSLRAMPGGSVHAIYDDDDGERVRPYAATGFMLGNAGIGQALLRLALLCDGRQDTLVLLPDQPFGD